MNKVWGGFLAVTGFIACPCHFPITLPFAAALLGGSGVAGFITANTTLIYTFGTIYFIVGLAAGWYFLTKPSASAASCAVPRSTTAKRPRASGMTARRLMEAFRRI